MQTVQIPGGEAVLLDQQSEMTPRRRRPVEIVSSRIGRKAQAMATAARVLIDGDVVVDNSAAKHEDGSPVFVGGDVEVSERELGLVMRLNDVMVLSLLKSWTLHLPLPTSEDELGDLPMDVFAALRVHAGRVSAEMRSRGDEFGVDAVEDPASPTGG